VILKPVVSEELHMAQAKGTFIVELKAQPLFHEGASALLGRRSIDKVFSGELAGSSAGEMLSAGTAVDGSAGYVAIEHVRGTLAGRTGEFVLQHSCVMVRGMPEQSITVIADSGTGALTGLTGQMTITVADGKHGYVFDYTLP
jgi:hypothetical protein